MSKVKIDQALDWSFWSQDLHEELTIRNYLRELLSTLWHEDEGFNGKRPFGNSGWQWDIYKQLVIGSFISGVSTDEEFDFDEAEGREFVQGMIKRVFEVKK